MSLELKTIFELIEHLLPSTLRLIHLIIKQILILNQKQNEMKLIIIIKFLLYQYLYNYKTCMFQRTLTIAILVLLFAQSISKEPLMLEAKEDFINKVSKTNMAVFFYGTQNSQQYQAYEGILPSDRQLFSGLEFYFIPADSIKISKKKQTLFIFRNIEGNEWLTYEGPMQTSMMSEWVRHNCFDSLRQLTGQDIDDMFVNRKKGFVLLQFGQFELLSTKILINDFCKQKGMLCGKCTVNNPILNIVVQLMRADDEPGVPKLAYWDPNTQKFQLYTQVPLHLITYQNLIEISEGREGLVKSDVSPSKIERVQEGEEEEEATEQQPDEENNEEL